MTIRNERIVVGLNDRHFINAELHRFRFPAAIARFTVMSPCSALRSCCEFMKAAYSGVTGMRLKCRCVNITPVGMPLRMTNADNSAVVISATGRCGISYVMSKISVQHHLAVGISIE